MHAIRTATLCLALITAATVYAAEAEYLGGTAKSIPLNLTGRLDLSDPNDLIFAYGKGVYRLPFERIKSYQWDHSKGTGRRVFGRVPIPHLPWGKQEEILSLSFRVDGNTIGVLNFQLSGKDLPSAEWALNSRMEEPESTARAGRVKLGESWWGDKYWRTNRNVATWPAAETEAGGTQ